LTPEPSAIGAPVEERRAFPVTANATPEFSQTALHDADEELNQVWNKLTAKQRARLRREEQEWAKYKDSLPEEQQLQEIRHRTEYLLHVAD